MKLVDLHHSQLMVKDRSADKRSGVNLALLSPAYPSPLSPMSGDWESSVAAADTSDLVGICVCVTNACLSRPQAVSNSDRFYNFYSLYNTVEIRL